MFIVTLHFNISKHAPTRKGGLRKVSAKYLLEEVFSLPLDCWSDKDVSKGKNKNRVKTKIYITIKHANF